MNNYTIIAILFTILAAIFGAIGTYKARQANRNEIVKNSERQTENIKREIERSSSEIKKETNNIAQELKLEKVKLRNQEVNRIFDAMKLGLFTVAWMGEFYSKPKDENIKSSKIVLEEFLKRFDFEIKVPLENEKRTMMFEEIYFRFEARDQNKLKEAYKLGYILALFDKSVYANDPSSLDKIVKLGKEIEISEIWINEWFKSVITSNGSIGELTLNYINEWNKKTLSEE